MVPEPLLMCPNRPTSTVGSDGQIGSKQSTRLPIVDSTIMRAGQIVHWPVQAARRAVGSLQSQKLSQSLGLSPQSQVNINGASKICGTIFAIVLVILGSGRLSHFAISALTKVFAK
jgi:hypothetical protein